MIEKDVEKMNVEEGEDGTVHIREFLDDEGFLAVEALISDNSIEVRLSDGGRTIWLIACTKDSICDDSAFLSALRAAFVLRDVFDMVAQRLRVMAGRTDV